MTRLVPLVRVNDGFHARVVAARLGAEGIVTQLRGDHASPYPMGDVEVLVEEARLADAMSLLLADEVESSFERPVDARRRRVVPLAVVAVLVALLIVGDIAAMRL